MDITQLSDTLQAVPSEAMWIDPAGDDNDLFHAMDLSWENYPLYFEAPCIRVKPAVTWVCTDTTVGLYLYEFQLAFGSVPFAISFQQYRKSRRHYFITQDTQVLGYVREYLAKFRVFDEGRNPTSLIQSDTIDEILVMIDQTDYKRNVTNNVDI